MKKGLILMAVAFFCFLTISPVTFAGSDGYDMPTPPPMPPMPPLPPPPPPLVLPATDVRLPYVAGNWGGLVKFSAADSSFKDTNSPPRKLFFSIGVTNQIITFYYCERGLCSSGEYSAPVTIYSDNDMTMQAGDGKLTFYPDTNANIANLYFVLDEFGYSFRVFFSPKRIKGKYLNEFWFQDADGEITIDMVSGVIDLRKTR